MIVWAKPSFTILGRAAFSGFTNLFSLSDSKRMTRMPARKNLIPANWMIAHVSLLAIENIS